MAKLTTHQISGIPDHGKTRKNDQHLALFVDKTLTIIKKLGSSYDLHSSDLGGCLKLVVVDLIYLDWSKSDIPPVINFTKRIFSANFLP